MNIIKISILLHYFLFKPDYQLGIRRNDIIFGDNLGCQVLFSLPEHLHLLLHHVDPRRFHEIVAIIGLLLGVGFYEIEVLKLAVFHRVEAMSLLFCISLLLTKFFLYDGNNFLFLAELSDQFIHTLELCDVHVLVVFELGLPLPFVVVELLAYIRYLLLVKLLSLVERID